MKAGVVVQPSPMSGAEEMLATFMPGDSDENRALRARIYAARDMAHVRACRYASFDAGRLSHIASEIAGPWAFNRHAKGDELDAVIKILTWLFLAAGALERLEAGNG